MLDINYALIQLKKQLEDNSKLTDYEFHITQGECVNENQNYAPWLGIYTKQVEHDPETLGTTQRRWKGNVSLILVVQASSLKSGEDCYRLLEDYVKDVISAVINDTTFGNSIDLINKLTVDYTYKNTESETLYFQEAFITIETEMEHENEDN